MKQNLLCKKMVVHQRLILLGVHLQACSTKFTCKLIWHNGQGFKPIFNMLHSFEILKYIMTYIISKNWPKCNHFICHYMQLLVICEYILTFLQLFLVLVIFPTTLQLPCNYFGVHPFVWITFSLVFIQEKQFVSH
jgi:hypothetical protein